MVDRDHYPSSSSSLSRDEDMTGPAAGSSHSQSDGFTVRGAPWSSIAAPDTSSMDDFPDLSQVRIWVRSAGLNWVRSYTSSMDDFPDLSRVRIWVRSAGSLLGQVTHQQHGRTTSPTPVGSVSRSDQLGQVTEVIQIIWVLNKVQFHWNIVISVWVYEWTSNSTSNSVSVLTIILFTVLFMLS